MLVVFDGVNVAAWLIQTGFGLKVKVATGFGGTMILKESVTTHPVLEITVSMTV